MQLVASLLGCPVALGAIGRPVELGAQGRPGTIIGVNMLVAGLSAATVFLVRYAGPGGDVVRTFAEDEVVLLAPTPAAPVLTAAAHERPPPAAPGAPASK